MFSQGYRPGTLAARGFAPEALAALRPGIVHVELSAWSVAGPWARRRGFDTIVQCASGLAMIQGGAQPRLLPVSAIDYVTGYLMAFGAMIALKRRAREGGSWRVRLSLARTGQWIADRGLLDARAIADVPKELPADEIARFTMETRIAARQHSPHHAGRADARDAAALVAPAGARSATMRRNGSRAKDGARGRPIAAPDARATCDGDPQDGVVERHEQLVTQRRGRTRRMDEDGVMGEQIECQGDGSREADRRRVPRHRQTDDAKAIGHYRPEKESRREAIIAQRDMLIADAAPTPSRIGTSATT